MSNRFTDLALDGVIRLTNTSLRYTTDQVSTAKVSVIDNLFQDIEFNTNGGGIKITSYDSVLIGGNQFISIVESANAIDLKGASLYMEGQYATNVRLISNAFTTNTASVGGAIAYDYYSPQVDETNTFTSNTATLFGPDVAGYATRLAFISEDTARALTSFDFTSSFTAYSVTGINELTSFTITGH